MLQEENHNHCHHSNEGCIGVIRPAYNSTDEVSERISQCIALPNLI